MLVDVTRSLLRAGCPPCHGSSLHRASHSDRRGAATGQQAACRCTARTNHTNRSAIAKSTRVRRGPSSASVQATTTCRRNNASAHRPKRRHHTSALDRCAAGRTQSMIAHMLSLLAGVAFLAPQIDPASYQHLEWRCIGPFRGGRTVGAAGIPERPNTFLSGSITAACGAPTMQAAPGSQCSTANRPARLARWRLRRATPT